MAGPGVRGRIVSDKNPHGIQHLADMLEELALITLGVQGDEAEQAHPSSELTVGQIAAVHELGLAPGAPQRSWLRGWVDENEKEMRRDAAEAVKKVLEGESRKKVFAPLGLKWAEGIRKRIREGRVPPPLSPTTIARRGGSWEPLYDTHTLHNAVTYKLYIPQWKSVPREVLRRMKSRR